MIPDIVIGSGENRITVNPFDLKLMTQSCILSPFFLTLLAQHPKPYVRDLSAKNMNTPSHVLKQLVHDESTMVATSAYLNTQTPLIEVLKNWNFNNPEGTIAHFKDTHERNSEIKKFLKDVNIEQDEASNIPLAWILKLFG